MISIVTGTLNRKELLTELISNTVDSNNNLELVLVDGGSDDGTIEFIESLNHPRIKLIKVGERSSYPHFMNLGIQNATYDWICQWNDDVILINQWEDIINELNDEHQFYLFNWKYGNIQDIKDEQWLSGFDYLSGWCMVDNVSSGGEIVMNYGIYHKNIFKKIGMYNNSYKYYYADGDMSYRAHMFGFKHKPMSNIKVCSLWTQKNAIHSNDDTEIYNQNIEMYRQNILPNNIEFLK